MGPDWYKTYKQSNTHKYTTSDWHTKQIKGYTLWTYKHTRSKNSTAPLKVEYLNKNVKTLSSINFETHIYLVFDKMIQY